jgi:hypothetical protein
LLNWEPMKVKYLNLEHKSDPDNNREFLDASDVLSLLETDHPSRKLPYSFELYGDNEWILDIGIETPSHGFAQLERLEPWACLVAIDPETADSTNMDYRVGGTLTPISGYYRISAKRIPEIISHFVATGEPSRHISWEEFDPRK